MPFRIPILAWLAAVSVYVSVASAPGQSPSDETAPADRTEPLPPELEGVGITEHLDAELPLDLVFKDEEGQSVRLGDYFDRGKPVILTLNYYRCPMLCSLQLNGLIESLKELGWLPGEQFEIVTVSFDPLETPLLARAKKQNYLEDYGRLDAGRGWHFLTGAKEPIRTLTDTVGFGYKWNPDRKEWMHAAALILCTPDGRVSRYLYGVMYDTKTLRLSLVEAADNKIGSPLDQILLYCYHYDAASGRYGPAAWRIMQIGGVFTVLVVGLLLVGLRFRGSAARREGPPPEQG